MMNIFISYRRVDQTFAVRLTQALEATGYNVWIDLDDIPAGQKWSDAIQSGLDAADVLLLIVTPESIASSNVADEWQYIHSRKQPIIPIWLRPTAMPFQLDRLQRIDFTGDFDYGFRKLTTELANIKNHPKAKITPNTVAHKSKLKFPRMATVTGLGVIILLVAGFVLNAVVGDNQKPMLEVETSSPATLQSSTTNTSSTAPTSIISATGLVTVAQYAEFLNRRAFPPDSRDAAGNRLFNIADVPLMLNEGLQRWEYDEATANELFTDVSWYGANTFCEAQDLSLPSETDINLASPVLEWLIDNRIAGRGSIEIAAKTFASADVAFRCVEQ